MLKEEEVYWKQKSQIRIQEGDKNTKFFHAHIVKWRPSNKILGLENFQGVWCIKQSQVDVIAVSYFQNLFLTCSSRRVPEITDYVKARISAEDMKRLM